MRGRAAERSDRGGWAFERRAPPKHVAKKVEARFREVSRLIEGVYGNYGASPDLLEFHYPVGGREEGVVGAPPDVAPGMEASAALANQYAAGPNGLTCETLDPEPLGVAVSTVAARSYAFLVGHGSAASVSGLKI